MVAAFMVGLDDEIFVIAVRRRRDPHAGARDLVAGPRRHRRAGHEPRRRPIRRRGRAGARRPTTDRLTAVPTARPPSPEPGPISREVGEVRARSRMHGQTAARCTPCIMLVACGALVLIGPARPTGSTGERGRAPRPMPLRWPVRRKVGRRPRSWPRPTEHVLVSFARRRRRGRRRGAHRWHACHGAGAASVRHADSSPNPSTVHFRDVSAEQPRVTASEAMAAAPATVGDPVIDRSPNGDGVTGRHGVVPTATTTHPPLRSVDSRARAAERPQKLTRRERRHFGRLRARKVKRVVRHFDPWSVLKVSLVASTSACSSC